MCSCVYVNYYYSFVFCEINIAHLMKTFINELECEFLLKRLFLSQELLGGK